MIIFHALIWYSDITLWHLSWHNGSTKNPLHKEKLTIVIVWLIGGYHDLSFILFDILVHQCPEYYHKYLRDCKGLRKQVVLEGFLLVIILTNIEIPGFFLFHAATLSINRNTVNSCDHIKMLAGARSQNYSTNFLPIHIVCSHYTENWLPNIKLQQLHQRVWLDKADICPPPFPLNSGTPIASANFLSGI